MPEQVKWPEEEEEEEDDDDVRHSQFEMCLEVAVVSFTPCQNLRAEIVPSAQNRNNRRSFINLMAYILSPYYCK
jgi:hypothetical protein